MRKLTVFEKNDFECIFDRFEVQVVTVWSNRLGKHKTFAFLLMVDFLRLFKITHFFEIFEGLLKIIGITC